MSQSSSSTLSITYGPELVTNGSFSGTTGWTLLGGGLTASSNKLWASGATGAPVKNATQSVAITAGRAYRLYFEFAAISGSTSLTTTIGGNTYATSSTGAYENTFVASSTASLSFLFVTTPSSSATLTSVSARELLEESSSSGSSTSSSSASSDSSSQSVTETSISSSSSESSKSSSYESSISSSSISSGSESSSSSTWITYSSSSKSSSSTQVLLSSLSSSSLSSSSLSSLSSRSSKSSSSSSLSSSSVSSLSSSSISSPSSSSSTVALPTSSSQSTQSSSSSSSSWEEAYYNLGFKFNGYVDKSVNAMVRNGEYVYAGTSENGVIIRSSDFYTWETFAETGDEKVKSLIVWGNALFAGTEPNGEVYTYNFTSDESYVHVVTKDHEVSCFCDHNNVLYVGTKPNGYIYTFDGYRWNEVYKAYGGINKMLSFGGKLYVLCDNAETVPVFDGTNWTSLTISNTTYKNYGSKETIASYKTTAGLPFDHETLQALDKTEVTNAAKKEVVPKQPEQNLTDGGVMGSSLLLIGERGKLLSYDGSLISTQYQSDIRGEAKIAVLNGTTMAFSIDGRLYFRRVNNGN